MSDRIAYRAAWLFTDGEEPMRDPIIEIADGLIAEVREARGREPGAVDLGNVALLPGLVNCHTHLEFSDLTAPLEPAQPFAAWIGSVIAHRSNRQTDTATILREGFTETLSTGTTTVGEIATAADDDYQLTNYHPRVVRFIELLGINETAANGTIKRLRHFAAILKRISTPRVREGLSPHAPYSVHPKLFEAIVLEALRARLPLAFHLAETREELQLLATGDGPIVDLLQSLGLWRDDIFPRGSTPMDYLARLAGPPRVLIIHGNYLSDPELEFIAARDEFSLIYCPRTHAYFGHEPHPWLKLLSRGGRVALGTDSRASNPDLNLWNEVRFLRAHFPDVPPATLLRLATSAGAEALGLADETGRLEAGLAADVCLIALPQGDGDPWSLLFNGESHPIGVLLGGVPVPLLATQPV